MTADEEAFSRELGQRIAALRKEHDLTQARLAELLGTRQYVIANYETGRYRVPSAALPPLAAALSVSVEELLGVAPARARRGPASKLQRQLEAVSRLPKSEQQLVSQLLERFVAKAG